MPRRSARLAAAAAAGEREATLWPLPVSVALHIFSLLPVDQRLRCREVCRAWRATLAERSLWTRLDLRTASGIARSVDSRAAWNSLLRCAAAAAGGGLVAVDSRGSRRICGEELARVAALNAGTLRELHVAMLSQNEVDAILQAAPLLHVLEADEASCSDCALVHQWLRNEAPLFSPLRIHSLHFDMPMLHMHGTDEVPALAADIAAHESLQEVEIFDANLRSAAAMDAIVNAALTRRLHTMVFGTCALSHAAAPALVRLIDGGVLTSLTIWDKHPRLDPPNSPCFLDLPGATLLAVALRASRLTKLYFENVNLWRPDCVVGIAIFYAFMGHPTLRSLGLTYDSPATLNVNDHFAAGAALGALITADAPALLELNITETEWKYGALAFVFNALPSNTHLRSLTFSGCGEAFVRDTLLPAVRANTSLRKLDLERLPWPCAREAEAVVNSRAAAEL